MYAIGIDMSKDTFHAAFPGGKVTKFANTDNGIEKFVTLLEELNLSHKKTVIGTEATGIYHLLLAVTLTAQQWKVVVINPLESHKMIMSGLRTVKTDRLDSIKIRDMVILGRGYPFSDTEDVIALKALIVERQALVKMRASLKQQTSVHMKKAQAVGMPARHYFDPVMESLTEAIKRMESHMQDYEEDTQELLRTIPGVGPISSAALVAFVGKIERFSSPEKLVAYIGLDPRVYESGTSIRGRGFISKRGNKYLRHVLFNASFIATRRNPVLGAYYNKKIKEGKHHFSALCAIERKLIHIIYAVWRQGKPFEKR